MLAATASGNGSRTSEAWVCLCVRCLFFLAFIHGKSLVKCCTCIKINSDINVSHTVTLKKRSCSSSQRSLISDQSAVGLSESKTPNVLEIWKLLFTHGFSCYFVLWGSALHLKIYSNIILIFFFFKVQSWLAWEWLYYKSIILHFGKKVWKFKIKKPFLLQLIIKYRKNVNNVKYY